MERLVASSKVAGIKQTKNAVLQGKAKVVYLADDASPDLTDGIRLLCAEHGVEVVSGVSKKEIAKSCKIDVPCAAAALIIN